MVTMSDKDYTEYMEFKELQSCVAKYLDTKMQNQQTLNRIWELQKLVGITKEDLWKLSKKFVSIFARKMDRWNLESNYSFNLI